MIKHDSSSLDSVQENVMVGKGDNIQTNPPVPVPGPVSDLKHFTPENGGESPSAVLGNDDALYPKKHCQSVNSVNTEISQKYSITLEEARNRALKAVKRARKRKPLLLDEGD